MNTAEIAKINKTKYFIEYICNDLNNTYYQLVRTEDQAILCAFSKLDDVYARCFLCGIHCSEVSLW